MTNDATENDMSPADAADLPALPEGEEAMMFMGGTVVYSANQMHAYARAAIAADRARGADPMAWHCFHCGEAFTDKESAQIHFGPSENDQPICQMDAEYIRWLLAQHRRNVDDDSEALRTVRSLANEHETLRRRAEEIGYARGLDDAKKHPEQLGLYAAPPAPAAVALMDERLLELARQHLDKGLSWAPHITRCTDLEIRAFARAIEAAHGITPHPEKPT